MLIFGAVTKSYITRMFKSNSGEPYAGKLHVRFLEEFISNCLIIREGENLLMKKLIQLYVSWFKMGLFTFGGGYAMLPMIQKEVIEKYHWATEDEVMDYYAIGQCTPGVIAVNTSTFIGYYQAGVPGAIAATLGVVTPSIIIISIITGLITNFSSLAIVQHALNGIRVAVCMLMINAVLKLGKGNIKNKIGFLIFAVALIFAMFTKVSTVLLVIGAGIAGVVFSRIGWLKKND